MVRASTDRPGIVGRIGQFLSNSGANITALDQYSTEDTPGVFFRRTEFSLPGLPERLPELVERFDAEVAKPVDLTFQLVEAARRKKTAIMVSRYDHCLMDLLWRARREELDIDIEMVISNHPDLADAVAEFGIPFIHIPVTKDTKADAERQQLDVLAGKVDLVVLARYMQIISDDFLSAVGCPLINIHHSFLPAFIGANPYHRAKQRGVKLIGATAHYVTADLDEGPIIDQDVVRVTHQDDTAGLIRRGADVERQVLTRAVQLHSEDRVARHGNSTIIF
ncbi:formyltetrahydrofolate deformylase [Gordonia terrae]|uniref:formyltetrahydrofolate deformylase n=1 Tax=Gordonia hongkongensis TaxID=1701090 RepID=UPI0022B484B1|nr:formyltetrahydrofolate deformylase [Gordonia terrae]